MHWNAGISQIEPLKTKPTDRNVLCECVRLFPQTDAIRQELLSLANDQPQQTAHDQTLRLSTEHHSLPNDDQPRRSFLTVASGSALAGILGAYGTFGYMLGKFVYPAAGNAKGWLFVCTVDHLAEGGLVAFLLPAMGFLHNHAANAVEARTRLFREASVKRVINFSDLRFQLFEKAVRPAALFIYGIHPNGTPFERFDYWAPKADLNLRFQI